MKTIQLEGVGEVQIVKHAQAKSIRITIGNTNKVRVSIPKWAPYQAGVKFAQAKQAWILEHFTPTEKLPHGMAIGKFHHLYYQPSSEVANVGTRQKGSELWVTFPDMLQTTSPEVQNAAHRLATKALRKQAERLLPGRLQTLASKHGFTFTSVEVRQLKARWGSCNSKQEITLNLFLMQLPWDLIDYVLLHELTHTKALHHGPDFWAIFEQALPGAKQKRRALKDYKPALG